MLAQFSTTWIVSMLVRISDSRAPMRVPDFGWKFPKEKHHVVEPRHRENEQFHDLRNALKVPVRLKTFVKLAMDVASASPRRYFFEVMSYFATAEHEKERLQYFASPAGRDDFYEYNQKEGRTVLEVLEDFPSVQMPFEC